MGDELHPVKLDQVLGLTTGAIEIREKPLRCAPGEVRDHVADVQTKSRRFDSGCHSARLPPGMGPHARPRPTDTQASPGQFLRRSKASSQLPPTGADHEGVVGVLRHLEPEILLVPKRTDALVELLEVRIFGGDLVVDFV